MKRVRLDSMPTETSVIGGRVCHDDSNLDQMKRLTHRSVRLEGAWEEEGGVRIRVHLPMTYFSIFPGQVVTAVGTGANKHFTIARFLRVSPFSHAVEASFFGE